MMEYIYVSSRQDLDKFPQNVWHDFSVALPTELYHKMVGNVLYWL